LGKGSPQFRRLAAAEKAAMKPALEARFGTATARQFNVQDRIV
jgi:hypothetical protein